MGDTATALRLLRAHLAAASEIVEALDPQPLPAPPAEEPEAACPHCNEKREEKFEDTSFTDEGGKLTPRVTCLSCGRSFNPKAEEVVNG